MARIAVTQRLVEDPGTGEVRDCLDVRWADFFAAAGLVLLPIPSGASPAEWLASAGEVAGLLLTGGNDLTSVAPSALNARRQAFEEALLHARPNLSVLGVCRGCQLLAARDGFQVAPVGGHVRTRHRLTLVEGVTAQPWATQAGREVNSFHAQGVTGAGRTLQPTLRAPDGTVEALASLPGARRRVAGLLWHPEREARPHPADLALFQEVFA